MKSSDIVIVNWNAGKQLKECIDSINKASKINCKLDSIVVVDNASTDNSLKLLDKSQNNLKIINNNENLGFGKACNQGAKSLASDYILFLNPDMLIFEDTFTKLFNYIEKYDNFHIGIYGIQLIDKNNNIQRNCARLPTISSFINRSLGLNKLNSSFFPSYTMEDWDHKNTKEVDQVMGAFFMIKRDIFDSLNGFDERFFVYYEELDLSTRVKYAGYKTIFVSDSKAYHKSGGTSENVKAKRLFYNTRSRLIYAFKHFGLLQGFLLMIFTFLVEPITRTLFLLIKSKFDEIIETLKGFGMLYGDSLNIIKTGLKK